MGWRTVTSTTSSPRPRRTRMRPATPPTTRRRAMHLAAAGYSYFWGHRYADAQRCNAAASRADQASGPGCRGLRHDAARLLPRRGTRRARRVRRRVAHRPADLQSPPAPARRGVRVVPSHGGERVDRRLRRRDRLRPPESGARPLDAPPRGAHLLQLVPRRACAAAPAISAARSRCSATPTTCATASATGPEEPHAQHPRLVLRRDAQRRPRP
jgi:hypothetical protein